MKRWRCLACTQRGLTEEWDDHRTASFCHACGMAGTVIVEFACFACRDEGLRFEDVDAPEHPCPECEGPAYRVVYAPYIGRSSSKTSDYQAADRMLVQELEQQGLSTTSLQRERPEPSREVEAAHALMAQAMPDATPRAHWAPANQLLPAGGKGVGGQLPFGMPRPITQIAGADPRPAKA